MGSTRDLFTATAADVLFPFFRRPMEDVVYETLDHRQVPTRTDFHELRDVVNSLRGKVDGAAGGASRNVETLDDLSRRLEQIEARLSAIEKRGSTQVAQPSAKECKVDGCGGSLRAKGFCAKHYQKWRRGTLEGFPGGDA
ncbi:MAG: hypothetical protein QGG40_03535 [Myxococcota bacterium]|jgi:hypothetical protein|nr:hypothetical protein [Myxococcota bacterium]